MADFDHLLAETHRRGMRMVLDMVFNHTSTEHDWFKRAEAGEQPYVDFYIWRDGVPGTPPNNWQSKFGGSGRGTNGVSNTICICTRRSRPISTGKIRRCARR